MKQKRLARKVVVVLQCAVLDVVRGAVELQVFNKQGWKSIGDREIMRAT